LPPVRGARLRAWRRSCRPRRRNQRKLSSCHAVNPPRPYARGPATHPDSVDPCSFIQPIRPLGGHLSLLHFTIRDRTVDLFPLLRLRKSSEPSEAYVSRGCANSLTLS